MAILAFLFKHKYIILGVITAALLFGAGVYIRGVIADNARLEKELGEAKADLVVCQNDKAITQEVSSDYQTKINALNSQLAAIKRVRDNPKCIPITR